MEALMGAAYSDDAEGLMRRIENEGLMAAIIRIASLNALGGWVALRKISDEGRDEWTAGPFGSPIPDGYVLVGTDEDGGPLTKSEVIDALVRLKREG
jgi:hypothetical protein